MSAIFKKVMKDFSAVYITLELLSAHFKSQLIGDFHTGVSPATKVLVDSANRFTSDPKLNQYIFKKKKSDDITMVPKPRLVPHLKCFSVGPEALRCLPRWQV